MTTHAHCPKPQQLLAPEAFIHAEAGLTIEIIGALGTIGDADLRVVVDGIGETWTCKSGIWLSNAWFVTFLCDR